MKTIQRNKLNKALKQDFQKVINTDGFVYEFVGIGWFKCGKATDQDKENYPQVID